MKKLLLLLIPFLFSCEEKKYTHIGQEIIDGKISAVKEGFLGRRGSLPKIWVQTPTSTREVDI